MSPHPSLNAFTPGTWARVVSGVVWADYAVNEGQVTAKTARGPLALLSLTGEGEDLPRLHAPTPDALEVEAHRLNLRAFEAMRFEDVHVWKITVEVPPGPSASKRSRAAYRLRAAGLANYIESFTMVETLADLGSSFSDVSEDRDRDLLPVIARVLGILDKTVQQRLVLRKFIYLLKFTYSRRVRFLIAAAYRAHLARKVRPPARRSRIPRPIHARPRPPTCPAAPPVNA